MYTVFYLQTKFNPLFERQISREYAQMKRSRRNGVVKFRGLDWRLLNDNRLAVEVYGKLVNPSRLPPALRRAVIDTIAINDFLPSEECGVECGYYRYRTAGAFVTMTLPYGDTRMTEIDVRGEDIRDINDLYTSLMQGHLRPLAH